MPNARIWVVGFVASAIASPALGGLVVTSYQTLAQTNGYAPTSQTQFFAEHRLVDISPAVTEVFGDWTGPNADGTPDTWHYVGTSRAASTTTITAESFRVEASASSSYQLDTTAAFVDPGSAGLFRPGGTASYRGFFEADVPISYAITAHLNQLSSVRLISSDGAIIFRQTNSGTITQFVDVSGTLLPGSFSILATTGPGVPNLSNGVHHRTGSGNFENFVFTARIPEPSLVSGVAVIVILLSRRPRPGLS